MSGASILRGHPRVAARGVALATALVWACGKPAPPRVSQTQVTVAMASRATVPYTITANGVVEPLQTVAIQAQIGGELMEVGFHEGDEVKKGQVIFRLDPRPYQAALRQAQGALARDRAQSENASRDAARYQALVAKGYVTTSQADQMRASAAAQGAVVEADSAAIEAAQLNLAYATIKAPITGRTGSLLVRAGNVVRVPSTTPLVVINQIQPVLVRFTVPQRTLPDLQRVIRGGQTPAVRASPTAADSTRSTPVAEVGSLDFMDNAVDTTTGAITLKARFANSSHALWPGQFLTVSIDLFNEQNALTVPAIAVQTGQDGNYVYVIDSAGKARMAPVTVNRTAGETAVIGSGLEVGTRVVTDGQSRLFPGAQVVVRGPTAPSGPKGSSSNRPVVTAGGEAP